MAQTRIINGRKVALSYDEHESGDVITFCRDIETGACLFCVVLDDAVPPNSALFTALSNAYCMGRAMGYRDGQRAVLDKMEAQQADTVFIHKHDENKQPSTGKENQP